MSQHNRILLFSSIALLAVVVITTATLCVLYRPTSTTPLPYVTSTTGSVTTTAASTTTATTTTTTAATTTTTTTIKTQASPTVSQTGVTLDPDYERLILVNPFTPLPEDYDYTGNLTKIDAKYLNGSLNQIDKDIYPYLKAMLDAAWADGVKLYVRSPYRSYSTQQYLFNNKVKKVIAAGTPEDKAEAEAATVVARPGTSEHHTGLAIDFNVAASSFDNSAMSKWLLEHGADYGFILRYPKDKMDVTGIVYESWHWRFVGINVAKEIKQLGLTLEEYLILREQQA